MHAGFDRRDPGRPQGTDRLSGWGSRERAELARTARRSPATRPGERSRIGHRRWRAWLLEGARRDLAGHAPPALLGSQDRERIEQGGKVSATGHETGAARGMDGA